MKLLRIRDRLIKLPEAMIQNSASHVPERRMLIKGENIEKRPSRMDKI